MQTNTKKNETDNHNKKKRQVDGDDSFSIFRSKGAYKKFNLLSCPPYIMDEGDASRAIVSSRGVRKMMRQTTVQLVSETHRQLNVLMRNTHPSIVNAIRGIVMNETPSVRCEHLFVKTNESVVINQTLAQRLGQLRIGLPAHHLRYEYEADGPIGVVAPTTVYPPDYTFSNKRGHGVGKRPGFPDASTLLKEMPVADPDMELVFDLDVTCYFDFERECLVHDHVWSQDLVWRPIGDQAARFAIGDIQLKHGVCLARLAEGQRLAFQVWACKGIAFEHAKWSCAQAAFRVVPEIQLHPSLVRDIEEVGVARSVLAQRLLAVCGDKVFAADPVNDHHQLVVDPLKCTLCNGCVDLKIKPDQPDAFDNDMITIPHKEKDYLLTVTSTDGQAARDILRHALRSIQNTYANIAHHLRASAQ